MEGRGNASSVWDRIAPLYDLQARLERPALQAALELAAVSADDRVLDAGCGTGQWLRLCAGAHRPRRLVGVDRSPAMLARAGGTGAELVAADLRRLPFDDSAFDVVCCAYVLHLLDAEDVELALVELCRVLAAGGRLVTVTPFAPPGPRGELQRRAASWLSGTRLHAMLGLRPFDPRSALEAVGFSVDDRAEIVTKGYTSLCTRNRLAGEVS